MFQNVALLMQWPLLHAQFIMLLFFLELPAFALNFQQYHDQAFIAEFLRRAATENSALVRFEKLGESQEGREIALVRLSKGPAEDKPAIYINATHHGNEKASTEAALGFIDYLIRHQDQPVISQFLSRYAIFVQPLVNPDGHARNSRFDSQGRDPNRDYAHPKRSAEQSFRLVETRLVRNLLKRQRFVAAAALHSGIEAVLWPWCHSQLPTNDHKAFVNLGRIIADAMSISNYSQSHDDYRTEGEFIDYAYMQYGTYAVTVEVSQALKPHPKHLSQVVQRSIKGTLAFISALDHVLKPQNTQPTKTSTDLIAH
ncbi:MAG: M14 family metallopeptidase [Oligoflexus sp.]